MFVKDWMTATPATLAPTDTLLHARSLMSARHIRHLPVVENGKLVGVLSDRDMRDHTPSFCSTLDVYEMHAMIAQLTARDAMSQTPATVEPEDTIAYAGEKMLAKGVGSLVVTRGEEVCGIITQTDLLRALVAADRREAVRVTPCEAPGKPGEIEC